MEFQIKKATIVDLEKIQELNKKLCVKEFSEFDNTINPDYPITEKGKKYFTERIEDEKNSFAYVAFGNNKIIGYFIGCINLVEDYRTLENVGEGETTFVEKEFRNQGIGTQFIKMFEKWAKEKGIKRLRYIASSKNKEAIKLYKKLGCEEYGVVLEKILE
ncbi:MAG: GNAT family N-acetyltransferase [Patescibacteria group bacterium]